MNKGYIVRGYKEGDEEGIFELWQSVHPDKPIDRDEWMRYWAWLYRENPAGEGIIQIAEDDGKIICHHAIIPIWLKIGAEQVLGSWGVDAMTHPQYRRQGIWEKVIREIWARAADSGIDVTPGFPNRYSMPGLTNKLQWFRISETKLAVNPLDWKKTVSIKVSNGFVAEILCILANIASGVMRITSGPFAGIEDVSITNITSFDDRVAGLWKKISSQYHIMTVRNEEYLNWRFSRPDTEYKITAAEKNGEITGYSVINNQRFNGVPVSYIVDLIAESPEIMRYLISESIRTCKRDDTAAVLFSFIADESYRKSLKREGFIFPPFLKGGPFCARLNTDRFSRSLLEDYRNWMVQPSDADTL